jgi:hypothetical protein
MAIKKCFSFGSKFFVYDYKNSSKFSCEVHVQYNYGTKEHACNYFNKQYYSQGQSD